MGQCVYHNRHNSMSGSTGRIVGTLDISVVIPVYRSVDTLMPLFQRIEATMTGAGKTFEVIFILDGDHDESWQELLKVKKCAGDNVRLLNLAKNYGQNAATICGIEHAKGQILITMDDDLQTPPEEIIKLLEYYEAEEVDVIFGAPIKRSRPPLRRLGAWAGRLWYRSIEGSDFGTSFRLIGNRVKENINSGGSGQILNQMIHWYTSDIATVEVKNEPRESGRSGYTFIDLSMIMLRLVVFYTDFPLRLMTGAGAILSLLCFGLGAYYIWEKFTLGAELGFTSIIVAIFFATGIILMALSIIGMYINRIYEERNHKPMYSVRREV